MTVLEGIQRSTEFLSKKGVDAPRLQAELLLAQVLGLPRMRLYLNFERMLSARELDSFRDLVKRRGQREPLQQITGSTSFCGLEISVNRHVLVPRPETEALAEKAWVFLQQLRGSLPQTSIGSGPATALDFGTGSGCLAVTLAHRCPAARISALDCSAEALGVAKVNAARHGLSERIQFFNGADFSVLPEASRFDLIVSNPPYIPSAEIERLQPEVRDYEPRGALDGGPDGLRFYRQLALEGARFLEARGKMMVEFGDGQAESLRPIFQSQNWIVESIEPDYNQHPRILIARRPD